MDRNAHPSGKLKDAITYALNQKEYLCVFLDHGEVELSNNQVENAIRPLVVGRKGWLFCDTPEGAETTAILYTILETAKANHLNLETYLRHLLTTLPQRQAKDSECTIDDLLPWSAPCKTGSRLRNVERLRSCCNPSHSYRRV